MVEPALLRRFALLSGLPEDALREAASLMYVSSRRVGDVIISEGEQCRAVYFVASGVVRLRKLSVEGREFTLGYVGAGSCFDLVAAFDEKPHFASAEALTDVSLLVLPCRDFHRIALKFPAFLEASARFLASEVRRLSLVAEELALHTVRTRLARFLLDLTDGKQPSRRWTQEEIAAHIGTVREMVGRTLRDFATAGLIRRERGRLVVLDRAGLEREAGRR